VNRPLLVLVLLLLLLPSALAVSVKLISNTDYCFSCETIYEICKDDAKDDNLAFDIAYYKAAGAKMTSTFTKEVYVIQPIQKIEQVPVYDTRLVTQTIADNKTGLNTTREVSETYIKSYTDKAVTTEQYTKQAITSASSALQAAKPAECFKISVKGSIKPGEAVDNVLKIGDVSYTAWAWWNNSFGVKYPLTYTCNNVAGCTNEWIAYNMSSNFSSYGKNFRVVLNDTIELPYEYDADGMLYFFLNGSYNIAVTNVALYFSAVNVTDNSNEGVKLYYEGCDGAAGSIAAKYSVWEDSGGTDIKINTSDSSTLRAGFGQFCDFTSSTTTDYRGIEMLFEGNENVTTGWLFYTHFWRLARAGPAPRATLRDRSDVDQGLSAQYISPAWKEWSGAFHTLKGDVSSGWQLYKYEINKTGNKYIFSENGTGLVSTNLRTDGGWTNKLDRVAWDSSPASSYTGVQQSFDEAVISKFNISLYQTKGTFIVGDKQLLWTEPPINITIQQPQNMSYNYTHLPINLSLAYSVVGNYSMCWYSLNGAANVSLGSCLNSTFSINANNSYSLFVYGNNTAGAISSKNVTFNTRFVLPTAPTDITIYPVPIYIPLNSTIRINWTESIGDNVTYGNMQFNNTNPPIPPDTLPDTASRYYDFVAVSVGNYTLGVYAKDMFNQTSSTALSNDFNVCAINYTCTHFGSCHADNVSKCLEVQDLGCYTPFTGALGDYDADCAYVQVGLNPLSNQGIFIMALFILLWLAFMAMAFIFGSMHLALLALIFGAIGGLMMTQISLIGGLAIILSSFGVILAEKSD
jgi:hypothetical protein